jgi:mannosyl-oligosaccharide glucosidase
MKIYILLFLCFIYETKSDCLWSTYRPGPYFGMRATVAESPLFGLMWYYPGSRTAVKTLRHFMENSDNMTKYEWKTHNGCNYGELYIEDAEMSVSFNIAFTNEVDENGLNHWVVNLRGLQQEKKEGIVILVYLSNSNTNSLNESHNEKTYGLNYNITSGLLDGIYNYESKKIFNFLAVQSEQNNHPIYENETFDGEYYLVLDLPQERLYDPSEFIITELKDIVGNTPNRLIDSKDSYRSVGLTKGNVFVKQFFFIGEFRLDFHFFDSVIDKSKLELTYVDNLISNERTKFFLKFNEIFCQKENSKFFSNFRIEQTAVSALSTLLSNIIYMNGYLNILDPETNSMKLSKNLELLTVAPDKTSHSHGFMWDEGFQQNLVSLWDINLSFKIVRNWFFNIDDETGWLAREQILDTESRARSPPSSWAAIPNVSNPPSLYLFIENLFERNIEKSLLTNFLLNILDKISKNAQWFIQTQESKLEFVYSWIGKTDDFCLPSGLDDYPRSRLNGQDFNEGHLDLQSWMITITRTMIKIYKFLDEGVYKKEIIYWTNLKINLQSKLKELFWNQEKSVFDDFYINNFQIKIFSGHLGYIQLFPFILNTLEDDIINNEVYIKSCLDLILNQEKGLRTNFGIRSLSVNDPYYKKGQNYWTSPLWVNINYLIIKSLKRLSQNPQYSYLEKDYTDLRKSVVNNMIKNFSENGFIWEVYDDIDGHGKYNHPFTGWSALVVNLIYELY